MMFLIFVREVIYVNNQQIEANTRVFTSYTGMTLGESFLIINDYINHKRVTEDSDLKWFLKNVVNIGHDVEFYSISELGVEGVESLLPFIKRGGVDNNKT